MRKLLWGLQTSARVGASYTASKPNSCRHHRRPAPPPSHATFNHSYNLPWVTMLSFYDLVDNAANILSLTWRQLVDQCLLRAAGESQKQQQQWRKGCPARPGPRRQHHHHHHRAAQLRWRTPRRWWPGDELSARLFGGVYFDFIARFGALCLMLSAGLSHPEHWGNLGVVILALRGRDGENLGLCWEWRRGDKSERAG